MNIKNFILKPFDFTRFEKVIKTIHPKLGTHITIKDGKKLEHLNLENIIAFEGYSNYIKIHTVHKLYVSYYKLSDIENELKENPDFIRINRSFIISKNHIEKIETKTVYLKNGIKTNVGFTYKTHFTSLIKNVNIQSAK